jgi:hypothetical protein
MIDDILDYLSDNPSLTRRIAAFEIGIGLWLMLR